MSPATPEASATAAPVPLSGIAWVMVRDGNRTLGGGLATMELLRRTGIDRGWFDEADNALLVAASRLTPGTNVLAYCVGLGWKLRGVAGALTALAAASIPSALAITILSATLVRVDRYLIVRVLLAIGTMVAAALVLASTWPLLRPHVRAGARARTAAIAAIASGLLLLDATPVQTLLVAAAAGAALQR
jgi:chromate transporter